MNEGQSLRQLGDVGRYFGFLFGQGYGIRYADYSPDLFGNWVVEFASADCAIYLTSDRCHLTLEFSPPSERDPKNRTSIEKLIYRISEGRKIVPPFRGGSVWNQKKQLKRLAALLRENLPEITAHFSLMAIAGS